MGYIYVGIGYITPTLGDKCELTSFCALFGRGVGICIFLKKNHHRWRCSTANMTSDHSYD